MVLLLGDNMERENYTYMFYLNWVVIFQFELIVIMKKCDFFIVKFLRVIRIFQFCMKFLEFKML